MEKDNWINEVLASTKGMQKAEPPPFLFEQITTRIHKGDFISVPVSPFLKWGLTSLVLIILSLNVISIINTNKEIVSTETSAASFFNNAITYNY